MKRLTKQTSFMVGIGIIATAILTLLFFIEGRSSQDEARHVAVEYLRKTTDLDRELKNLVLEAHAFQLDNYDPLVKVAQQINGICPDIQHAQDAFLVSFNPSTAQDLEQYCKASAESLEALEDFKSANSLLRNSLTYFPVIASGFKSDRTKVFALGLYNEILAYCLQPTPALLAPIYQQLALVPSLIKASGQDKAALRAFEKHAYLVISTTELRRKLEKQIYNPSVDDAIQKVTDGYMYSTDLLEARSHKVKLTAILVSAGLLLSLFLLLYKLRVSTESLSELNATLEQKVESRTVDLKNALSSLEQQQQVLAQTAKMSALGEMAGSIAHEINTPLGAISLKAETLLLFEPDEISKKTLAEIIKIVEQAAKIVSGLRRFARNDKNEDFQTYSLKTVVDDTLILCGQKFQTNNVELRVKVEHDLLVRCLPEQISQILLNLLNNAYDAIGKTESPWVEIEIQSVADTAVLRVTNSGPGIPPAIREKLMQPFFTTKEPGKGTGIGLSISKGIAEKHGGSLTYVPTDLLTVFELKLPIIHQIPDVA